MKKRTEIIIVCSLFGLVWLVAMIVNFYNYMTGAYG